MSLYYREKGNPSQPPLLLLHGLWGASENWLPVATLLAEHFYVLLPDMRNHGHSPWSDRHDYEVLSEDIMHFIKQFQWERKPFIAGHSMGGKTVMTLLLKRPEIITRAAIIDISPREYEISTASMHSRLLDFLLKTPLQDLGDRKQIHAYIRRQFPEEEVHQLLFKNLRKTSQGWIWKINASAIQNNLGALTSWPFSAFSGSYRSPILFLKGELSEYITPEDYTCISEFFPSARVNIIPQATHRIHADQPALLAQSLIDFFLNE